MFSRTFATVVMDITLSKKVFQKAIKESNSIYKDCKQVSELILQILLSEIDVDLMHWMLACL